MIATVLISALIVVAAIGALKYTRKHGTCEACGINPGNGSCNGQDCGGCALHPMELEQEREYMKEWEKKFPDQVKK